ncbi:hypothetical protein Aargi30884_17410 [Amedibacterium intestinale]|uniref:Coenzyme PQQ synthesis protein D n=1 Tax=Amedibacterium intestinale TaxID=2583452 RepID=A0A6N4TJ17_9FIRM|nr:PqqD family protein [Amedibacterium intestinale]BBK22838.1 hypothetical protein Aargi30884_17410 [Amedibacterium intestinale]
MKKLKKTMKSRIRKIANKKILIIMNKYYELNDLGEMIITNLDGEKSSEDIINVISRMFPDIDESTIRLDVNNYLNFLLDAGAIEEV